MYRDTDALKKKLKNMRVKGESLFTIMLLFSSHLHVF